LLFSSAEKLVIVRFANADMPRLVMAGEYDQLDLTFKDEEFLNKVLEPARDGKEVDRSPQKNNLQPSQPLPNRLSALFSSSLLISFSSVPLYKFPNIDHRGYCRKHCI